MCFPEIDYRRDPQQAVPFCYCSACRGEIYTEESAVVIDGEYFCEECGYAGENAEALPVADEARRFQGNGEFTDENCVCQKFERKETE